MVAVKNVNKFQKLIYRFKYYPIRGFFLIKSLSRKEGMITNDEHASILLSFYLELIIVFVLLYPLFSLIEYKILGKYYLLDTKYDIMLYALFMLYILYVYCCFYIIVFLNAFFIDKPNQYSRYCKIFDREPTSVKLKWIKRMFIVDISIVVSACILITLMYKLFHYLLPLIFG